MPATSISSRQAILPPIDDPSVHVQIDKLARRYDDAVGLIMEMLASVGGGAQGLIDRLPGFVRKRLDRITLVALNRAFDAATQSRRYVRDRGDWFNRLASTVSGAAGGMAGLPGAMVELPLTVTMLLRAILEIAAEHGSIPGALAAAGLRGSDFIQGWKRREDPLDIGLIDEASMLDERQFDDLREIFPLLVLFGDPAQLAPVGQSGEMVFDRLAASQKLELHRIHRQADDSPILDLAHALSDPAVDFPAFERLVREAAASDPRVVWAERMDADLMARSPALVWRNATRVRLITAFRAAHGAPGDLLLPGEPLVCDGIELPLKHRKKRIDLEARGLIKGAQVIYLGPGKKPGFSRLHVIGTPEPRLSAASIVKIETPDVEEPFIPFAARMGATFLHGAAETIHKAQGSQWPEVQVFAPDLSAAAWSNRTEAGLPLWKRLAYVAITRAQERLFWVTRAALARPRAGLSVDDLAAESLPLELSAPEAEAE